MWVYKNCHKSFNATPLFVLSGLRRARSLARPTFEVVTSPSVFLSVKRKTPLFSFFAFVECTEALCAS